VKRYLSALLLSLLFLVSFFVPLEVTFRLLDVRSERHLFQTKYSPRFHHYDLHVEEFFENISKKNFGSAKKKILIIGDSFISGEDIDYEYRATTLLIQQLESLLPNQFEIFSLGQGSWSTLIYKRALESVLEYLSPDLIFVAIDQSDPVDDYVYSRELEGGDDSDFIDTIIHRIEKSWISKIIIHSKALMSFDSIFIKYFRFSFFFPWLPDEMLQRHNERVVRQSVISNDPGSTASYFKLVAQSMLEMDEMIDDSSKLVFITFPRADHLAHQKKSSFFEGYIREDNETLPYVDYWMKETQLDKLFNRSVFISTYKAFKEHDEEGPLFFWKDDVHWNERGHSLFADQLLKIIVDYFKVYLGTD